MNPDAADLAMKWAALNMARQQKLNRNSPEACKALTTYIHAGLAYAEACAAPWTCDCGLMVETHTTLTGRPREHKPSCRSLFAPEAPSDPESIESAFLNRSVLPIRRKPGGGLGGAA